MTHYNSTKDNNMKRFLIVLAIISMFVISSLPIWPFLIFHTMAGAGSLATMGLILSVLFSGMLASKW
jgi:hypothetical protein